MQEKFKNKKSGFTVIETLFGIAIFIMILGAITLFSKDIWIYNSTLSSGLLNADAARQILKTMASEIRAAETADTGAYTIASAGASAFIFYSDIDDDGLKEKVRYFLSGAALQRGVVKPTGSPLAYTGSETISTLASNVTNTSLFDYYDKNYDGTTPPLTLPVNAVDVRLVKITIVMDENPNRAPSALNLSTQVSIRNLKDNL